MTILEIRLEQIMATREFGLFVGICLIVIIFGIVGIAFEAGED